MTFREKTLRKKIASKYVFEEAEFCTLDATNHEQQLYSWNRPSCLHPISAAHHVTQKGSRDSVKPPWIQQEEGTRLLNGKPDCYLAEVCPTSATTALQPVLWLSWKTSICFSGFCRIRVHKCKDKIQKADLCRPQRKDKIVLDRQIFPNWQLVPNIQFLFHAWNETRYSQVGATYCTKEAHTGFDIHRLSSRLWTWEKTGIRISTS